MDFFTQQDKARRNTRLLIILFVVAVLLLIVLTNVLIGALMWFSEDYSIYTGSRGITGYMQVFSWERFGTIGLGVTATVGLVSLLRWLQLAAGGKAIAESMGGQRILRQSTNADEKRCLNVVEELALAANMPVPPVYLLPDERGINAFAAGITPADAVVAVTRGTLLQLKRSELQGVIGHEFSHILNGDMRLGIRLTAVLKGITFIGDIGHFLLRSGRHTMGHGVRRDKNAAVLPIVGIGLLLVGWLGSLAAGFIKAAISRQKEYLADAGAVQFTRDNEGIADALKVIGGFIPGSLVNAARAPEMSHIFFGEIRHHIWESFATHPPLPSRIRRLDPRWDGQYLKREERRYAVGPLSADDASIGVGREALILAAAASLAVGDAATGHQPHAIDGLLLGAADDPLGATALALALLVARHGEQSSPALLLLISQQGVPGQAEQVQTLLPAASDLRPGERFPLIATAMPAMKSLSTQQYRQFKSTLLLVIRADRRTDLFEWCLFQLLRHYLDPEYLRVPPSRPRYRHLVRVRGPLRQVLSVLAHQGEDSSEQAFAAAVKSLGLDKLALQPLEECSVSAFSQGVNTLADCYPLLKPRILKALALAAADDGRVSATEREIVVAIAAVMDCPVPDDFALDGTS